MFQNLTTYQYLLQRLKINSTLEIVIPLYFQIFLTSRLTSEVNPSKKSKYYVIIGC